jgi:NADPH2:quinone reductase
MRALLSTAIGGPETLEIGELPHPEAKAGEVVVAVRACGVNYPDVLTIVDKYQFRPARPFSPGGEIAGVVESVGPDVTAFKSGDRVMGITGATGGFSEKVAVRAEYLYAIPEGKSFEAAAALLFTYATTIHALVDRGQIRPGHRMLVLGAAGGVGLAAVELGKVLGARVTAAASTEEKAHAALEAGADDSVIYGRSPFSKEEAKSLAGDFKEKGGETGFDLIYDAVGGDYAEPALRSIAWGGRYLVIGFPAGIPSMPLNLPLLRGCDICGVFWGAFAGRDPERNRANIMRLLAMWSGGNIAPRVTETFPLARGGEAIARMEARAAIGKLVVLPSE